MALDRHIDLRVLRQVTGLRAQRGGVLVIDVVLVRVEIDRRLARYGPFEMLLRAYGGAGRRRRGNIADAAAGTVPDITLRADTTLPYGRVVAVMGELNRAGLNSISLVTSGSVTAP